MTDITGFFDTHAHLLDEQFNRDRFKIIDNNLGLGGVVCMYEPGEDIRMLEELLKQDSIWAAAGVHPHFAKYFSSKKNQFKKILDKKKVVAVGEIGLDFYYKNSAPKIQKEVFKKQLKIADTKKMPVVVHSRKAFGETLDILKKFKDLKILIHCFTGTKKEVHKLIDRNYYIAVGGVVTFKNADSLKEAVKNIPLNRLVLETDCPYLAPSPVRGRRNQPDYVKYTARQIAQVKNISVDELKTITFKNADKIFQLQL